MGYCLPSVRAVQLCPGSIGEIYGSPRGQFRVFGAVGGQQYLLGRWLIFSASSLISYDASEPHRLGNVVESTYHRPPSRPHSMFTGSPSTAPPPG